MPLSRVTLTYFGSHRFAYTLAVSSGSTLAEAISGLLWGRIREKHYNIICERVSDIRIVERPIVFVIAIHNRVHIRLLLRAPNLYDANIVIVVRRRL